jgi:Uncharacterised nucleotidyltransferase
MTAGAELGRLVAAMLAGAWRVTPPPYTLPRSVLADINPLLLAGGVGALAWRRVSHGGDATLQVSPEAFELRQAYRLHSVEAALRVKQIEHALTLLRTSGVEPLLAKGWAAARHYPEPGLRPYGDIDLYVRPEQYQVAHAALFRSGIPPAPVDLHSGCPALEDRDMDPLYDRSETTMVGDEAARVFGPEDHLHLLCVHMLSHGVCRPLWLCDIGAALESLPREFDWDRFWGRSPRRSGWLRCALMLSHQLLGASLDKTPLAHRPYTLSSWVARTVREQWGSTFRPRLPMASFLRNPEGLFRELRHHWPNPIEATVGVGGAFTRAPRWPLQLAHSFLRSTRWATQLARLKLSAKRRVKEAYSSELSTS